MGDASKGCEGASKWEAGASQHLDSCDTVVDTKDTPGHRRYIPFIFYLFPGPIYQSTHWVPHIELNKMYPPKTPS